MLLAFTLIVSFFVSALCIVASLAIFRWDARQDHRYKIELMNSSQHSWEEFDMVNKDKFESDYWRITEDGSKSADREQV